MVVDPVVAGVFLYGGREFLCWFDSRPVDALAGDVYRLWFGLIVRQLRLTEPFGDCFAAVLAAAAMTPKTADWRVGEAVRPRVLIRFEDQLRRLILPCNFTLQKVDRPGQVNLLSIFTVGL